MSDRPKIRKLTAMDAAVLLLNVLEAADDPDIGTQDTHRTRKDILQQLAVSVKLSESLVESALWCSNMLHEKGRFKHPLGHSFDQFAKHLAGQRQTFDKNYNYFKDR